MKSEFKGENAAFWSRIAAGCRIVQVSITKLILLKSTLIKKNGVNSGQCK